MKIGRALAVSGDPVDRKLARSIAGFIKEMQATQLPADPTRAPEKAPGSKPVDIGPHH